MQIPFAVESGSLPRKVEIERRKREYTLLASNFDLLLKDMNVDSQVCSYINVQALLCHLSISGGEGIVIICYKDSKTFESKNATPTSLPS